MSAPSPKEIREAFKDYRNDWQEIRDEAAIDMRYVAGDPWEPEDRAQREAAGRPCISLDELSQYLNQYVNNLRQNKRAIQVMPKGDGANDADAKNRSAVIMGIEERSNAQNAYITAAENAASRSYGFAVIRTEFKNYNVPDKGEIDPGVFDLEIIIKPILNPDTVLLSPFYNQPDASDVPDAFLLEQIPRKSFAAKYPDAEITDFSGQVMGDEGVSDWITDKNVQIAEYWRVEHEYKKLLLIETEKGPIVFREDEWKQAKEMGLKGSVKRERRVEIPKVVQYMTNGLEILDEVPWMGTRIPIISCFGKELWITQGGKATRKLLSMIRLARDPQMLAAYLATQECEEAGMIPKAPFVGAKGQFESDKQAWEEVNKIPHAFLQYDPIVDVNSQSTLPPPARPQYEANFQQWEIAKDSASRAIQRSMGIAPLPTAALRAGEKSGVALEKIQDQEAIGSFHFSDNFDRFLHNLGWQINELITPILDTQREQAVTEPDGTRSVLHIVGNTSHPVGDDGAYEVKSIPTDDKGRTVDHLHTGVGDFDVTISTGPSYQSQRQKQSEFLDKLIENGPNLPMPNTPQAKILALGIRMNADLGAIGTQIADVFDPPDPNNLPPEAQAALMQIKGQLQQVQQENAQLHMERAGKVIEQQGKLQIAQVQGQHKLDSETIGFITKVVVAQLAAKSKATDLEAQQDADKELTMLGFHENHITNAHDIAMQKDQQQHEHSIADKQHGQNMQLAEQSAMNAKEQQHTQIQADQEQAQTQGQ
jgi:hypothetical protein